MSRLRTVLVVAAGLILIASSVAHSLLGWPQLSMRLTAEHVSLDLVAGLAMGWHLAGVSMLTFGLVLLWLASAAQRSLSVRVPVGIIGIAYIAFAAGAAAAYGFDFIQVVFLMPGALLTTAALIPDR
jgi:hypothetical protein